MPAGGPKLNRNKASQDVKKQDNLDTFLKQLESGLETNIKGELGALKVEIAQTIMEKLGLPTGSEMDVTKEYADAFTQVMKSLTESGEKVGMDQVEGVTIIHVDETTDIEVLEMKVEPLLSYYEMTIEDGMMQFTNQAGELSIIIALDKVSNISIEGNEEKEKSDIHVDDYYYDFQDVNLEEAYNGIENESSEYFIENYIYNQGGIVDSKETLASYVVKPLLGACEFAFDKNLVSYGSDIRGGVGYIELRIDNLSKENLLIIQSLNEEGIYSIQYSDSSQHTLGDSRGNGIPFVRISFEAQTTIDLQKESMDFVGKLQHQKYMLEEFDLDDQNSLLQLHNIVSLGVDITNEEFNQSLAYMIETGVLIKVGNKIYYSYEYFRANNIVKKNVAEIDYLLDLEWTHEKIINSTLVDNNNYDKCFEELYNLNPGGLSTNVTKDELTRITLAINAAHNNYNLDDLRGKRKELLNESLISQEMANYLIRKGYCGQITTMKFTSDTEKSISRATSLYELMDLLLVSREQFKNIGYNVDGFYEHLRLIKNGEKNLKDKYGSQYDIFSGLTRQYGLRDSAKRICFSNEIVSSLSNMGENVELETSNGVANIMILDGLSVEVIKEKMKIYTKHFHLNLNDNIISFRSKTSGSIQIRLNLGSIKETSKTIQDKKLSDRILDKYSQIIGNKDYIEYFKKYFGKNIILSNIHSPIVGSILRDLTLVPIDVLNSLFRNGVKLRIGSGDLIYLSGNDYFKNNAPRGWNKKNRKGVNGAYDPGSKIVYAGGLSLGTKSLIGHEIGHAIDHMIGLESTQFIDLKHKQYFKKLSKYQQQGGPGGKAGKSEFVAELFVHYFTAKNRFVKRYDKQTYDYIDGIVKSLK